MKRKSWYLEYPLKDEEVKNAQMLLAKAAGIFQSMKPLNDYLNKALADLRMPAGQLKGHSKTPALPRAERKEQRRAIP